MTDTEETPAQRSARIRKEKREAKIRDGGQQRLDKITKLSGRTPESMRNESPTATPPRDASPALPSTPMPMQTTDSEQLRQQQEFLRALLRSQSPPQQTEGQGQGQEQGQELGQEDPMLKMLTSMLGGTGVGSNATGGMPSLNPDDLAKATGLPSFVTNMMMGKAETPEMPAEVREKKVWKLLHLVFAVIAGVYTFWILDNLTSVFGVKPPAPATIQNPFVIFITGELLLHGTRTVLSSSQTKKGFGFWLQTAKETAGDGAIVVFMLGMYNWWQGSL